MELEEKLDTFGEIFDRGGNQPIQAIGSAEPGESKDSMSSSSWVAVDKDTHMVEVRRIVATYDIGTLLNDKTGINQLHGGIVWASALRSMRRPSSTRSTAGP